MFNEWNALQSAAFCFCAHSPVESAVNCSCVDESNPVKLVVSRVVPIICPSKTQSAAAAFELLLTQEAVWAVAQSWIGHPPRPLLLSHPCLHPCVLLYSLKAHGDHRHSLGSKPIKPYSCTVTNKSSGLNRPLSKQLCMCILDSRDCLDTPQTYSSKL